MTLDVFQIPAFQDNYLWLLRANGQTTVVDPGDPQPVIDFIERHGWSLDYIWNTHHHLDHVGGNLTLKHRYGCTVIGPAADRERIPGIDQLVNEGDRVELGGISAEVFFTPGHTRGHICYYIASEQKAFVGDTLFALGCGRLFEGTPAQMWDSLQKIRAWPGSTKIYCAHEYTESNGRFALSIDPDNAALKARMLAVTKARKAGEPTVPFLLADDLKTNPFLRADQPDLKHALGTTDRSAVETFALIRKQKDSAC